ncbi:MAG: HEAT repeat domain-containing protein [Planctomycetes bacterium]|nr:HEAT repeat domain-containing protein [Planctomycetota bacterium]
MKHACLAIASAAFVLACVAPELPAQTATPAATQPSSSASPHQRAIEQVLASTRSPDPFRRANAVECVQVLPDRAGPVVQLALEDPQRSVRFAALVVIGRMKLSSLAPSAEPFLHDPEPSVRAAAIYALRANKKPVDMSPLAAMLGSRDPSLRSNAAMLLGMLGDKSALPMIREMSERPLPQRTSQASAAIARFQATEAIVKLGDDSALASLRAGPYSQYDELRVLAVQALGHVNDRAMTRAIEAILLQPPVELQLAAAESLARFGRPDGLEVTLLASQSPTPTVRAQAAMVLGLFPDPRAPQALERLLGDGDEQVRLSAAAATLGLSRVLGR